MTDIGAAMLVASAPLQWCRDLETAATAAANREHPAARAATTATLWQQAEQARDRGSPPFWGAAAPTSTANDLVWQAWVTVTRWTRLDPFAVLGPGPLPAAEATRIATWPPQGNEPAQGNEPVQGNEAVLAPLWDGETSPQQMVWAHQQSAWMLWQAIEDLAEESSDQNPDLRARQLLERWDEAQAMKARLNSWGLQELHQRAAVKPSEGSISLEPLPKPIEAARWWVYRHNGWAQDSQKMNPQWVQHHQHEADQQAHQACRTPQGRQQSMTAVETECVLSGQEPGAGRDGFEDFLRSRR